MVCATLRIAPNPENFLFEDQPANKIGYTENLNKTNSKINLNEKEALIKNRGLNLQIIKINDSLKNGITLK